MRVTNNKSDIEKNIEELHERIEKLNKTLDRFITSPPPTGGMNKPSGVWVPARAIYSLRIEIGAAEVVFDHLLNYIKTKKCYLFFHNYTPWFRVSDNGANDRRFCVKCGKVQEKTTRGAGGSGPQLPREVNYKDGGPDVYYCGNCHKCRREAIHDSQMRTAMILCPECGNKRCPKASDHNLICTDSNKPGQEGSIY